MKQYLLATAAALCLASSTTVSAQDTDPGMDSGMGTGMVHKLFCTYRIGDALGAIENEITKKDINFYDTNNRLVYTGYYGRGTTKNYQLSKITKYYYTEQSDSLIQTAKDFQWGLFDFGDFGFKEGAATGVQQRIWKGDKLLKEVSYTYTYDYEYNDNGTLAKTTKSYTSSGKVSEVTTCIYHEGKLIEEDIVDANGTFKLKNVYEYDEDGNKTVACQYKRTDKANEDTEYLYMKEDWTYEDGILVEYVKATNGKAANGDTPATEPVLSVKKTYDEYEGNSYKTIVRSYTYNKTDSTWMNSGLPYIEEYADFFEDTNTAQQLYYTELHAEPVEGTHDVKVSFMCPMIASAYTSKMDLYRDGHYLTTLDIQDKMNDENWDGILTAIDSTARAGHHEYFIHTWFSQDDDAPSFDSLTWIPGNVSPVTSVELNFNFKPVTDLQLVKAEKEVKEDGDGDKQTYRTAYILFKTPEYKEEDGFIENSLYSVTSIKGVNGVSDSYTQHDGTKEKTADTLSCVYENTKDSMNYFILTHYKHGNVKSETLTVKKSDFDAMATGLVALTAANNSVKVSLGNDAVSISDKADIRIITADGRQAAAAQNTDRLSLANIHGPYIVCVEKNGKILKAVKGIRK